jgi:hypothetical protein
MALLREEGGPVIAMVRGVVVLGIFIYSLVATVRLANALHGTGWAVGFGIMVCIPVVNLIALLILSMGASRRLRDAGITVGFLGADPRAVAAMKAAHEMPDYAGPKLAGQTCVHCQRKILVEGIAAPCKRCGEPVHKDCRKAHRAEMHPKAD